MCAEVLGPTVCVRVSRALQHIYVCRAMRGLCVCRRCVGYMCVCAGGMCVGRGCVEYVCEQGVCVEGAVTGEADMGVKEVR